MIIPYPTLNIVCKHLLVINYIASFSLSYSAAASADVL